MSVSGKNFIVTGGASGIGLATGKLLLERGANVALWDVNEKGLASAKTLTQIVDITNPDEVQAAMTKTFPEVHGVVHSAGILKTGTFETHDLNTYHRMIDINLFGTVTVARTVLPALQKTQGSLVMLASIAGLYGPPEYTVYGATKAAVLNFAQALRIEQRSYSVHIGVVCPHSVNTPMLTEQVWQAKYMQRFGVVHQPEQVAQAIIKGIEKRRFMIWPGVRPYGIFWLSRYASFASDAIMSFFWR